MTIDEKNALVLLLRKKIDLLQNTSCDRNQKLKSILEDIEETCSYALLKCN